MKVLAALSLGAVLVIAGCSTGDSNVGEPQGASAGALEDPATVEPALLEWSEADYVDLGQEFLDAGVDLDALAALAHQTFDGRDDAIATSSLSIHPQSGAVAVETVGEIAARLFGRRLLQAGIISALPVAGEALGVGILIFTLVEVGVEVLQLAARNAVCRCSVRPWGGASPPSTCPDRVKIPSFSGSQSECQRQARDELPEECRPHLGHCNVH